MQRDHSKQGLPTQDMPWQEELRDSFPYQATTELKAVQDVKRDMERSPDGSLCGDVGFGKTVAIRAIFKAVTAGKQVALPCFHYSCQQHHT